MKNEFITNIPQYEGVGIYAIINNRTGKMYIGSSVNIKNRIIQHEYSFKSLTCNNKFIHDIQQGDTFSSKVIEECPYGISEYELRNKEYDYMKQFDSWKNGYNFGSAYIDPKYKFAIIHNPTLKTKLKRIPLDVQKEKYEEIKAAADAAGEKVNEYIKNAIKQRMERDSAK